MKVYIKSSTEIPQEVLDWATKIEQLRHDVEGWNWTSKYEKESSIKSTAYDILRGEGQYYLELLKKYNVDTDIINAYQDFLNTDPAGKNNKYVLVCISGSDAGELFIDARKEGYGDHIYYVPNFTSKRMNNYTRAKLFKTYEDAENFMFNLVQKRGNIFDYSPVTVMTYGEAMSEIGDPYANQKAYKQSQADKKKQYAEQYKNVAKARNEKNKTKDPGKYKVTFYYSNSWLGSESYTVDAESIDDAFNQAKEKALRQDPYRNVSGYDHKMTFSKNYIRKVS